MTKAELIERIARSRDLPPDTSKKLIGQILGIAFDELASYFARARVTRSQSPRFTFPRFGTFTKKRRSARRGVNPRTLEPIRIEACNTIDFKASRELRDAMNPTLRAGDGSELPDGSASSGAPAVPVDVTGPTGVTGSTDHTGRPSPSVEVGERSGSLANSSSSGPSSTIKSSNTKSSTTKKKVKTRAKAKAARARDAASSRGIAVGPGRRRLTPRDDEPEQVPLALDATARVTPDPGLELSSSPMQRVSTRRRTRSRGTG